MQIRTSGNYQDGLLRHSMLLLMATQIGNVCNFLFQMLMMRRLSAVEYGILASMLSLILITSTPLEALRTAVAHQTALLSRSGQADAIAHFLAHWARLLGGVAVVTVVAGIAVSVPVAHFFHLPSASPVILTVFIVAGSLFMPYFMGGLQGMQAFVWMAAHGQVWGVVRYFAALLLVYMISRTAMIGLSAHAVGVLASILFGMIAFRVVLRADKAASAIPFRGGHYFLMSLFVLTGFAILMNADVALVKRFFSPEEAGVFAKAATISRSIVFLPVPIAAAMFPKVVSSGLSTLTDRGILLRAVLFTTALIVVSATICTVAADLLWRVFTGEYPDTETRFLLRWIFWAMAPLGLTFLLMNFEIAQRRFRAPAMLVLLAIVYVAGVALWHDTLAQVLTVLTCVNVTSLLVMIVKKRDVALPPGFRP